MKLKNFAEGHWVEGSGQGTALFHAVTGEQIAEATSQGLDFKAMMDYARKTGGLALRKMTFHERALMLKALALYLTSKKDLFYALSAATGATKADSWVDIEGGIGNLFVYAQQGQEGITQ
jgi:oxepin-CoA hydrolase / 3-oxo-5,6-dehydrosuberyl-CoA semialdehyde dehydrogenase